MNAQMKDVLRRLEREAWPKSIQEPMWAENTHAVKTEADG